MFMGRIRRLLRTTHYERGTLATHRNSHIVSPRETVYEMESG